MPVADPYQAALRDALVRAAPAARARARRRAIRQRVGFALVFALVVVASIVTVALPDDRVDARIDVQARDGRTYARLLDLESRPDEIVAALRNAGVNATVALVPVGPSNVGRFVGSVSSGPGAFKTTEGNTHSYKAFSLDQGYTGELVLQLGRLAADGEQWRSASNAMAKDEALSCRDIYGLTPVEATQALERARVSLRWIDARSGRNLEGGEEMRAPYANWKVIDALSFSLNEAVVRLTEHGEWPYGIEAPPRVDPSCKGR
jgi:hypothetical protein